MSAARRPAAPPAEPRPAAVPFTPLAQLAGQAQAVNQLARAPQAERVAHAYLLHGPSGVGKGTAALGMIQSLLCRAPRRTAAGQWACERCPPCLRLAAGSHPDLFQLTLQSGKTRISVDQVRELIDFLGLTAMEQGWKAALVDDAALMNEAAANALLKTLEEPTPRTLLMLVTSKLGALPATIRSRCRLVRFGLLGEEVLAGLLARHRPELAEADRQQAARLAQGSMARALALCGSGYSEARRRFADDLQSLRADRLGSLCAVAERWSKAAEFSQAALFLEEWLRERIHASVQDSTAGDAAALCALAGWWRNQRQRAYQFNVNRQLTLEAALIRITRL